MTSPQSRNRSRRATSHIAVRVAHAVLGGLVAVGWLVLPLATVGVGDAATVTRSVRIADEMGATQEAEGAPGQNGTATGDLVLPLVAVGAAAALAAYGYARRKRRARTRTTPGGAPHGTASVHELDVQTRQLLADTDDCVRTSAEELGCVTAQFGDEPVKPYAEALAYAKSELAAAFRLRQRLDGAAPQDGRSMLEEIVLRCTDAGRRLDSEAAGFDLLRALERNAAAPLERAETRFRELATRTPATQTTLGDLHKRYAPSASLPVAGHVEQAKDRLVFATVHLNQARQSLDRGESGKAAAYLRAAEGAVDQAAALVDGVERLAAELASATEQLPAALAGVEGDLAEARGLLATAGAGRLPGRVAHAESLLAHVRRETAAGPYDPLDALRRIAEAGTTLAEAGDRDLPDERVRALLGHFLLPARSAAAVAADFVTTHRAAVGCAARTRQAEAEHLLAAPSPGLSEVQRADDLIRQARELAERDVRAYGNPSGGDEGVGVGGAVLGGILLGHGDGPASFGGPRTRARRATPAA
ncbi:hypothetical protein [Streptomyces sp. NBC_00996]|uniref:hypothetical protein n=1 Tax=Streptomyces sp. NBC_00996 TaxID=2903710 RepID=UPI003865BC27|nr:hypothetical protein OG390_33595 [Streptomyces sp. NBC_00996]